MSTCVYCIAKSENQAVRIANRLRTEGVPTANISLLAPDRGARDLGHTNSTKAPEGAVAGVGSGAVIGGTLGWLAGIGALAIPGVGPLIAAGPILAALSGVAVGSTVGGLTGALVGTGIPEYEAQQYEGRLREGNILLSVHADDVTPASRIRQIMEEEKAESISTGSEAAVPVPH